MDKRVPKTCVTPDGFCYAVHSPSYKVKNLRKNSPIQTLGEFSNGTPHINSANFPSEDVTVHEADTVFEIPNQFSFRGTTFITKSWAESKVDDPNAICLPPRTSHSLCKTLKHLGHVVSTLSDRIKGLNHFPEPVLLAMASNSTDPDDLTALAHISCEIILDDTEMPTGLRYEKSHNYVKPLINDHTLFEIVVNNPSLPDSYKEIMVLRPGVQGNSEIIGEWQTKDNHIFEYLRRNSYIPWGHYAANMANDSIRYKANNLNQSDMDGLRHLYYQRTYTRFAEMLDLESPAHNQMLSIDEIEQLRINILNKLSQVESFELAFSSTLWGWNYGFDCSASKYRLHASHQMIHQQFALLPSSAPMHHNIDKLTTPPWQNYTPYGCGELVKECIELYEQTTGNEFFSDYEAAIRNNERMDGRHNLPGSLIVFEDQNVLLFVPKSQTSQWELQLMVIDAGNIIETDISARSSINKAMLTAVKTLASMGAEMVSTIEFPKRIHEKSNQRLLYSFLPKLPYSAGAFSEAQLRWVNGHYPEDFARACREKLVMS